METFTFSDPKDRFKGKSSQYSRYRPTYPEAMFRFIESKLGLAPVHRIADMGSGTGLSSKWLIQNGNLVYAVEPNTEMRLAAEHFFQNYPNFYSINGTAEKTNLPDHSVDFILVGQAFHWFEQKKARTELKRILKPNGYVIITWNERLTETSTFLQHFENLLIRYSKDYMKVDHRNISEEMLKEFYGHSRFDQRMFYNCQLFSWEGLKGRLLSMSYAPEKNQPEFHSMLKELSQLFRKNAIHGQVKFDYHTLVYFGQLE